MSVRTRECDPLLEQNEKRNNARHIQNVHIIPIVSRFICALMSTEVAKETIFAKSIERKQEKAMNEGQQQKLTKAANERI